MLLDQIAFLDGKVARLSARSAELAAAIPAAWGTDADGPPVRPITDPERLAHLYVRRRNRRGGILHEYRHAA